jgi:hypothetical protein
MLKILWGQGVCSAATNGTAAHVKFAGLLVIHIIVWFARMENALRNAVYAAKTEKLYINTGETQTQVIKLALFAE